MKKIARMMFVAAMAIATVEFTTDAVNRTLTADLVVYVQHEENGEGIPYGGTTTLHQTH